MLSLHMDQPVDDVCGIIQQILLKPVCLQNTIYVVLPDTVAELAGLLCRY